MQILHQFPTSSKVIRSTIAGVLVLPSIVVLLQLRRISHFPKEYPATSSGTSVLESGRVDWSRFAYTQYVTDIEYLCDSIMIFESLSRLGSKANRLLMYPSTFPSPDLTENDSMKARLLRLARDRFGAKLQPIEIQRNRWDYDTSMYNSLTV